MRGTAAVLVFALALSSCVVMSRSARDELEAEKDRLVADLRLARETEAAARAEVSSLRSDLDGQRQDLEAAREDARDQRRQAAELQFTVQALAAELDLAVFNYQSVLIAYEQQIRAAQEALHAEVAERLCDRQMENPSQKLDVDATVDEIIEAGPDIQAALVELPPMVFVDFEALAEVRDECLLQANLLAPKQDGFYLVGVEIAAGMWRSTGRGGSCFWARRDENQEVIASYFGPAGGSVTVQPTDFEIQFERCGIFEPLGF